MAVRYVLFAYNSLLETDRLVKIKNTWRIAVTLASAQSKTLTVDDLLKVSKALPKFYTSNDTQQLADLPDLKLSRKATDHLQS